MTSQERDIVIQYSRQADKFVSNSNRKLSFNIVNGLCHKAVKRIFGNNINIDLKKLKSKKNQYRIRYRHFRIIFQYDLKKQTIIVFIISVYNRDKSYKKR